MFCAAALSLLMGPQAFFCIPCTQVTELNIEDLKPHLILTLPLLLFSGNT